MGREDTQVMRKHLKLTSRMKLAMMHSMKDMIPSCEEVCALSSQAMDEPISLRKRAGIRVHLLMCQWCRLYRQQLHLIHTLIRRDASRIQDTAATEDRGLSDEAAKRMKQALGQREA